MNETRFNLNLMAVVEAIMLERNVTRAAAALGMSQPAVSNALRRARLLMRDQLFTRVAGGMQPTSRMLAIWPDLRHSLAAVRALVHHRFEPSSTANSFRLAVTDSLAADLVLGLTLDLLAASPASRISFSNHTNASSLDAVERGLLDCAVGMFPSLPRGLRVQGLFADRFVCVMRAGHALADGMTLDQFTAAGHALVTPSGQDLGVVDGWLSLRGRRRTITTVVNRFADALHIVAASDLIACVPQGVLSATAASDGLALAVADLPFAAERILYKLVWHDRVHGHPAHEWFRSLVLRRCGAVAAGEQSVGWTGALTEGVPTAATAG